MLTVDPITFEIVRHRLFRAVDEAILTLKHVSGSPITNEAHDLMVSLYTAEGDLLMGGVGFLHHMSCASEACKAIIRRFKGRIFEGDMFLLNDPYTAAFIRPMSTSCRRSISKASWSRGRPASFMSATSGR